MATTVTWNNTSYSIPASGELNWASLSDFLIALGGGAGQPGASVSGKAQKFGMRVATTTPVTVSDVNDCVVEVKLASPGATSVVLPAGVTGRVFFVVDGTGDAATNNITITPNGAETIMGGASLVMNVNKSSVLLGWDGTDWKVIAQYEGSSIPDSRLATISTAGKVANSATTATNANTASAIVARDGSGNFSAGTITATLSGTATNFSGSLSGDVTGTQSSTAISASTVTGKAITGFVSGAGTVSATDTILQAINKLDGNVAGKEPTITTLSASKGGLGTDASAFTGVVKASAGTFSAATVTNTDISASAAIDYSKLASLSSANLIVGSSTNVPTARAITGDVTISNTGVTAIASGVIVNADVNASAAIAGTKISPDFGSQNVTTTGSVGGTNVLNAGYEEFTGIATPGSNPAAGKIRVYAKTDNKLYKLDSSGNEAAVGSGSGSGGVNYLVDWYDATKAVGTVSTVAGGGNVTVSGSFPAVTSAWYADATSGAAAIASSSNNTLRGTTNYLSALSGTSTSGATFVQTPVFNIDGEDLGKALSVVFDISGVTADDNYDVVAVRYNSSGVFQELIPIAGNASSMTGTPSAKLPLGVKTFNGFFISGSTASDVYAIRFRRRAGSDQIRLDSLTVGPDQVLQGAIVTDWQSFTPTGSWTTGCTYAGKYRRVGECMELTYQVSVSGTPTATFLTLNMPSGFTIDTTKINVSDRSVVGSAFIRDGGARGYPATANYFTTTSFLIYHAEITGNGDSFVDNDSPITFASGDYVTASIMVPVSEFASANTQQAARAVEEYAYNTDVTSTASITGSGFANGPDGVGISANWTAVGTSTYTRRVRFQTPVLATDRLTVELFDTTLSQWTPSEYLFPRNVQSTLGYGIVMLGTSTVTDVDIQFAIGGSTASGSTYASNGSAWSTRTGYKWRVRKVSSGAAVGFPIAPANITLIDNSDNYGGNTKLGLMQYVAGTNYNGGISPTLSGTGVSTTRAVFVPYQMSDGTWRMKFNFRVTATSTTGLTITVNGVTFKNVSNYFQSVTNYPGGNYGRGNTNPNTGQINLSSDLATTAFAASGDVELDSKPTWAY